MKNYKFNYIFKFDIINIIVLNKVWKFIKKILNNIDIIIIFYN